MKNFILPAVVFLLVAVASPGAGAMTLIKDLPDKGTVAITGIVDDVKSDRKFVLRDASGTVNVTLSSSESLVLKPGEKVNVVGAVSTGWFGFGSKNVDASDVQVQKDLASTLSDTVAAATGVSVEAAKPVRVSDLPKQGMVRLLGTVDSVSDPKSFELKDPTGTVDVRVESDENVVLKKGVEVTVIGYIDSGIFHKTIRATRVIVSDSAIPSLGGG